MANMTFKTNLLPDANETRELGSSDKKWKIYANEVTTSTAGLMSAADKIKLDGITISANNYTLPVATVDTLGGIKSGTDITIDDGGNVSINDNSHNHDYLPLSGGTLTGLLTSKNIKLQDDCGIYAIHDTSTNVGLMCYKPTDVIWTGITSNDFGIGSQTTPTIIRSSGDNLQHYNKNTGETYKILDTSNVHANVYNALGYIKIGAEVINDSDTSHTEGTFSGASGYKAFMFMVQDKENSNYYFTTVFPIKTSSYRNCALYVPGATDNYYQFQFYISGDIMNVKRTQYPQIILYAYGIC